MDRAKHLYRTYFPPKPAKSECKNCKTLNREPRETSGEGRSSPLAEKYAKIASNLLYMRKTSFVGLDTLSCFLLAFSPDIQLSNKYVHLN